jgi:hypothetical protein
MQRYLQPSEEATGGAPFLPGGAPPSSPLGGRHFNRYATEKTTTASLVCYS